MGGLEPSRLYRDGEGEIVKNFTRGTVLAGRSKQAATAWQKISGLLAEPFPLKEGEALVIPSACPWIHTFFMTYPIDLVFIAPDGTVVGIERLKPWRLSKIYWKADRAIELPAGTIERSQTNVGDRISFT